MVNRWTAFEKDLKKQSVQGLESDGVRARTSHLPVRLVEIPKGWTAANARLASRLLVTVVAQTVVKMVLEPLVEPHVPRGLVWLPTRPLCASMRWGWRGSDAGDANWVIDLDVKAFFDSIPGSRPCPERAVAHHTDNFRGSGCTWRGGFVPPCSGRTVAWRSGRKARHKGGSLVRSWPTSSCTMRSMSGCEADFPRVQFERYADDAVVHCVSEAQARYVLEAIRRRLAECADSSFIQIKTKIVYCKDDDRRGDFEHMQVRLPRVHLPTSAGEAIAGGSSSSASSRRSVPRQPRRIRARPSAAGGWHPPGTTSSLEDLARLTNPVGTWLDELLRPVLPVEV